MKARLNQVDCCPRCTLEQEWLRLRSSPLLAAGGWSLYEGLLDSTTRRALLKEALEKEGRLDHIPDNVDQEQVRGGTPPRQLVSVNGGPALAALYGTQALSAFVAEQVGMPVRPCGVQATYSIYLGAGAGLGIHRDVRGCDLALIICLQDNDSMEGGGCIEAWPDALTTPLDELRKGRSATGVVFALPEGQSMLMHGGLVPHRIRGIKTGRQRVVALMCFEIVT